MSLWTYALRRVRDAFRANRTVEDSAEVERLMEEGRQMLALIQRQV
ncbi:LYR motif-containing protein 4 [Nematolebias whitei]|nr:LYR motif-containing protein 4 [Nematolebias whitei]